jgi:hypothetical protein
MKTRRQTENLWSTILPFIDWAGLIADNYWQAVQSGDILTDGVPFSPQCLDRGVVAYFVLRLSHFLAPLREN